MPFSLRKACHSAWVPRYEDTDGRQQCAESPSQRMRLYATRLLLLLARLLRRHVLLVLELGDLAKHDRGVAVEEGDAREALAVLERVDDERLLRLEDHLGHLVRLERVRRLHLLAAGLLADLEDELGRAAGGAAAAHEADGRVAELDLAGDVEGLDLRVELAALVEGLVLLVDHHVAHARHVDL